MIIYPINNINGTINVPGDKSISHRSIILSSLANGITNIRGFLMGDDCLSTIRCFKQLGVKIELGENVIKVHGNGIHGLKKPQDELYVGNSGTTFRLLTGILSAQPFTSTITGDNSIRKRPMKRIVEPLKLMGAKIEGNDNGNFCPLVIKGQKLHGITYKMPIASAQVKSCILLASLYADSPTKIIEPVPSRNHTELMMSYLGNNLNIKDSAINCKTNSKFNAKDIDIAGDISSAAYFIVAACILKNSRIRLNNVGINNTRDGIITILIQMGASIKYINQRTISGEEVADIIIQSSNLKGTVIEGNIIPKLIDEIPIIAVAACFATGKTIIKDAQELKVKESNRIKTMVTELKKIGADISETDDGMIINGKSSLKGSAQINSYDDHRVAMSMIIAGCRCENTIDIDNVKCIDISYPNFIHDITELSK